MLSAMPDRRSRKIVSNLNFMLLGSFLLLAAVLLIFSSIPIALFVSVFLSAYIELGIVVCARPFFQANAFLKQSYQNLLNYECSCALFSLPGLILSLIVSGFFTCSQYLNPSAGSAPIPEACNTFVLAYFLSFLLGPLLMLLLVVFVLIAISLFIGKLSVFASAAEKAEQGKFINYPLSITFFT